MNQSAIESTSYQLLRDRTSNGQAEWDELENATKTSSGGGQSSQTIDSAAAMISPYVEQTDESEKHGALHTSISEVDLTSESTSIAKSSPGTGSNKKSVSFWVSMAYPHGMMDCLEKCIPSSAGRRENNLAISRRIR